MSGGDKSAFETIKTTKVLHLLKGLKNTRPGMAIYTQIKAVLESMETTGYEVEQAYANILNTLLEPYIHSLPTDSDLITQVRLLQMRLMPPLSTTELKLIQDHFECLANDISALQNSAEQTIEKNLLALLESFSLNNQPKGLPLTSQTIKELEEKLDTGTIDALSTPEHKVDHVYRQHLDSKRERIDKIQGTLDQQIKESIRVNEEFGVLLEIGLEEIQYASNSGNIELMKETLINETKKFLAGHRVLATKLDNTHNYLNIIASDSQQLRDELSRVHLLSLTDELTNLPNRRAFLRRLEDEISRVHRQPQPLSLTFIDLDKFKAINDTYGHAIGDKVLKKFARESLSIFRYHDMVARYGGEEFVVLLPNTNIKNARKALTKVQQTTYAMNEREEGAIPSITFSAGLALHQEGESAEELLKRADHALYRAKELGRNRIEIAPTEIIEKAENENVVNS